MSSNKMSAKDAQIYPQTLQLTKLKHSIQLNCYTSSILNSPPEYTKHASFIQIARRGVVTQRSASNLNSSSNMSARSLR